MGMNPCLLSNGFTDGARLYFVLTEQVIPRKQAKKKINVLYCSTM